MKWMGTWNESLALTNETRSGKKKQKNINAPHRRLFGNWILLYTFSRALPRLITYYAFLIYLNSMNQAEWNEPKRQRMNHTDRIHTHRKLKTTWQDEMFYFGVFLRTPALFAAVRVEFSRCWHGFCVDLATKVP